MNRSLRSILVVFGFLTMIFTVGSAHAATQCHQNHSGSSHRHLDRFHPLNAHLKLQHVPRSASHHHYDGTMLASDALAPDQNPNMGYLPSVATLDFAHINRLMPVGFFADRSQSWAALQNARLYKLKSCYLI
jgi:hypothetical protein